MAAKDLDIEQLASYLHLNIEQVTKLVERGKLPGRRVGGQWRFSEAEIHHWLEERIGLSDADELGEVRKWLDRLPSSPHDPSDRFADLLPLACIAVPLHAKTRGSVIREMCDLAAQSGFLWDSGAMAEAVQAREDLHPTALENGVALLHPRRPQTSNLGESVIALGITSHAIAFGNRSGRPTDIFFLICSLDDRVHLQILAKLSRLVHEDDLMDRLREAASASEAYEMILEVEANWEGQAT
jgi:nitrogen PTS system EIIA component